MCGRYSLTAEPEELQHLFNLATRPEITPRYNIGPGQKIPLVRQDGSSGKNTLDLAYWGIRPAWENGSTLLINARSESAAEKATWRDAFRSRRCLVPANGYFEWDRRSTTKVPYYFHLAERPLFALAALWEAKPDGEDVEGTLACCVLTRPASTVVKHVHDRMPVILREKEQIALWLNAGTALPDLKSLCKGGPEDRRHYRVSPAVNSTRFGEPSCIEPLQE